MRLPSKEETLGSSPRRCVFYFFKKCSSNDRNFLFKTLQGIYPSNANIISAQKIIQIYPISRYF